MDMWHSELRLMTTIDILIKHGKSDKIAEIIIKNCT